MGNKASFDRIKEAVDKGIELMSTPNLNEDLFDIWLNYSQEILKISSNNPVFMSNYLRVILTAKTSSINTVERLSMCIKYLIGIMTLV